MTKENVNFENSDKSENNDALSSELGKLKISQSKPIIAQILLRH